MKKFLFALLLITTTLFASNLQTEEKIYALIIHTLLPDNQKIKVWGDTPHNKEILQNITDLQLVESPKDANFLLLDNNSSIETNALIFVTNYKILEKMQKSAIGGFFWQKGRPNILFLRKNLQKKNIQLPKSMQDFVEDEI